MKKIIKHSPFLDSRKYDDVCFLGHILCLLDGQISEEEKTKLIEKFKKEENEQCSLFNFCNAKTATCRVREPDESCYWYRYFKRLIEQKEENKQSPSFDFSNVKIAVREALPDESYEWYRWLNKLNEENK